MRDENGNGSQSAVQKMFLLPLTMLERSDESGASEREAGATAFSSSAFQH